MHHDESEYHVTNHGRVLEFEDGTTLSVVTMADMISAEDPLSPPPRTLSSRSKWAVKNIPRQRRWMFSK